jgi:hypothetical protein
MISMIWHEKFPLTHIIWQSTVIESYLRILDFRSVRQLFKPLCRVLPYKVTEHGTACMSQLRGRTLLTNHTYLLNLRSPRYNSNSDLAKTVPLYFLGRIRVHKLRDLSPN